MGGSKALLLLSGGLDSAAHLLLTRAADSAFSLSLALTLDYGQRAAAREIEQSQALCRYFGVSHRTLALPFLGSLGGSALTQRDLDLPVLKAEVLDSPTHTQASARAVWVPNRNGVFAEVAAAIAEAQGMDTVLLGFNREEAATFPDNSRNYMEALTGALAYSTQGRVRAGSLTVDLNKSEIVRRLRELEAELKIEFPWDLLWSCYQGGSKPCGKCESCLRLIRVRGKV